MTIYLFLNNIKMNIKIQTFIWQDYLLEVLMVLDYSL